MKKRAKCKICGKSLSIYNPAMTCFSHDVGRSGVSRDEGEDRKMLGNRPSAGIHRVLTEYYGGYHE